ncbi:50S ribosomal protein L21e [Candidatus Woesearchaeota archaeon]|nr:50S ribosomal protein L21e [Candidatus Woesearchaeota archaeon]
MVQRIGGSRRKTRNIMSVPGNLKGKLSISRLMAEFSVGDSVALRAAPAVHKGVYNRRFHGRTGTVVSVSGNACGVNLNDKGVVKRLIVNRVHLVKVDNGAKNN